MSILTTIENRVGIITINRPESRNAMTRDMWLELTDHVRDFSVNDDVGCIVLTGKDSAFCAGGDVKDMEARQRSGDPVQVDETSTQIRQFLESSRLLHDSPKPTIAAINGPAAGAGLSIALACDLRIMANEAKLTTAFANIALAGDFGGAWFLSRIVGTAKARELFYLSTVLSGEEAEAVGVVNKSVPAAEFAATVKAISEKIANGPTKTFGFMKSDFNMAEVTPLNTYLDHEALMMTLSFTTEDHREAATAFVEKRKPVFKGR